MAMTITCPSCGHEFELTPTDIARGVWRRTRCPRCHPPDEPVDDTERTDDHAGGIQRPDLDRLADHLARGKYQNDSP